MGQYHNGSFRIEAIETHTHTHNVKEIMAQNILNLMKALKLEHFYPRKSMTTKQEEH